MKTYRKLELPLAASIVLIKKLGKSQKLSLTKSRADYMGSEGSKLASWSAKARSKDSASAKADREKTTADF